MEQTGSICSNRARFACSTSDESAESCPSTATKTRVRSLCKSSKRQSSFTEICLWLLIFAATLRIAHAAPRTGADLILRRNQERHELHDLLLMRALTESPPPTTPHRHHLHHRSADNMNEHEAERCRQLSEQILRQANISFEYMWDQMIQYNKYVSSGAHNATDTDKMWSKFKLELQHPYQKNIAHTLMDVKSKDAPQHNFTPENFLTQVEEEFKNTYITLHLLKQVLQEMVNLRSGTQFNDEIRKFFEDAVIYTTFILNEVETAIKQESKPSLPPLHYEKDLKKDGHERAHEWVVLTEYFGIVHYLRELYKSILQQCPPQN